jgi:hypothetical protein
MNKKTSRNKPSQPAQKTLPAAVHAAALAQGSDAADVNDTPLVVENVTDTPAPAAEAEAPSHKAEKPGKPVTFSVTLPAGDAQRFDSLRHAHQPDGAKLKKSTVVRAALMALAELDQARVAELIASLQDDSEDKPKASRAKSKK